MISHSRPLLRGATKTLNRSVVLEDNKLCLDICGHNSPSEVERGDTYTYVQFSNAHAHCEYTSKIANDASIPHCKMTQSLVTSSKITTFRTVAL